MKRTLTIILTAILLLSFLPVLGVYADEKENSLSEDLKTLYINGESYTRADTTLVYTDYELIEGMQLALPEKLKGEISHYTVYADETEFSYSVNITYKDGAYLHASYILSACIDELSSIAKGNGGSYYIDFEYPNGNTVNTERALLLGEKTELDANELFDDGVEYTVAVTSNSERFTYQKGVLYSYNDEFYFIDFAEIELMAGDSFNVFDYETLTAWRITDEELTEKLREAENKNYGSFFGISDESLVTTVAAVFFIVVFCVVPFAILIAAIILAIRSRNKYRKMFTAIGILCASELILFAIICCILL